MISLPEPLTLLECEVSLSCPDFPATGGAYAARSRKIGGSCRTIKLLGDPLVELVADATARHAGPVYAAPKRLLMEVLE
jgi:hypothetical protein